MSVHLQLNWADRDPADHGQVEKSVLPFLSSNHGARYVYMYTQIRLVVSSKGNVFFLAPEIMYKTDMDDVRCPTRIRTSRNDTSQVFIFEFAFQCTVRMYMGLSLA